MGIFSGLSTPNWESPQDMWAHSTDQARLNLQAFEHGQARQDALNQQKMALAQAAVTAHKQAVVADAFKDTGDHHLQPWEVVQEHPEYLLDPATSKGVQAILKGSFDYAKTQAGTTEGKIALKQTEDFTKQLDALNADDPASVAAIRSMTKAKDGSPTAQQWQALSVAQQTAALAKKNAMTQAEIDARARGDNVTVTTGPKGTTVTAKPPTPKKQDPMGDKLAQSETMELPNGMGTMFRGAGSKQWFHFKGDGGPKKLTNQELRGIAKDMSDSDPNKKKIQDYLAGEATKQIGGTAEHNVAAPKGTPNDPLGILGK